MGKYAKRVLLARWGWWVESECLKAEELEFSGNFIAILKRAHDRPLRRAQGRS
jgi:hypothetical protein